MGFVVSGMWERRLDYAAREAEAEAEIDWERLGESQLP